MPLRVGSNIVDSRKAPLSSQHLHYFQIAQNTNQLLLSRIITIQTNKQPRHHESRNNYSPQLLLPRRCTSPQYRLSRTSCANCQVFKYKRNSTSKSSAESGDARSPPTVLENKGPILHLQNDDHIFRNPRHVLHQEKSSI